ncbi:MAG: hypothetical protein R2865_00030 [Deinococcales bacterium]
MMTEIAKELKQKTIGLLLSDEDDWPTAIEGLARHLFSKENLAEAYGVGVGLERIRIHPFSLYDKTKYNLVIDRLAWWHVNPREWLKKPLWSIKPICSITPLPSRAWKNIQPTAP